MAKYYWNTQIQIYKKLKKEFRTMDSRLRGNDKESLRGKDTPFFKGVTNYAGMTGHSHLSGS